MQALLDEACGGKSVFGQLQRLLERWKAEGVELSL